MYQSIPYRAAADVSSLSSSSSSSQSYSTVTTTSGSGSDGTNLKRLIAENPVLVVGRRGCCMCHVVKRLLLGLGVNPPVCEIGDEIDEAVLMEELLDQQQQQTVTRKMLFPAVFIGGRFVGGLDRLMAVHISGDLVPILKEAGALWL